MSGVARNSLQDKPGPLPDDPECNHRGQLPQDPPPEFCRHCDCAANFAVPHPNGLGQCLALCPWHLARYLEAYPDQEAQLRDRFDLDDYLPEAAWLGLDDLPSRTEVEGAEDRWELLALDQRGFGYYADDLDEIESVAVYATGDWSSVDELISVPEDSTIRDVCDRIADVHGLACVPGDVADRCAEANGGDGR